MLKIGIVGAGTIGRMHSEAIQNRADCVLAAVADVLPGRAEALADGAPCYTDYTQMCAQMCGQSMLDAVITTCRMVWIARPECIFSRTACPC